MTRILSFLKFSGNIWYYHHQYSPSNAWSVASLPRTNSLTSSSLVSPSMKNIRAGENLRTPQQTSGEELRSKTRTSRRISSNFSKKVSERITIQDPIDDTETMKSKNETCHHRPSFPSLLPDAVLVGYEDEVEVTSYRTTPAHVHQEAVTRGLSQPVTRVYDGKDVVVVQSLLRASQSTPAPSSRASRRSRPRPVYDHNKKKLRKISPASTLITVPSSSGSLSLPPPLLVTESLNTSLRTVSRTNNMKAETTIHPDPPRAMEKKIFEHAETQKLVSGTESSSEINLFILGIFVFSTYLPFEELH